MKRIVFPFIGFVVGVSAFGVARVDPAVSSEAVPIVRSEVADGNVSLALAGRDDDDEKTKAVNRARLRDHEAGTYINEILLARDSALARRHDRPRPPRP